MAWPSLPRFDQRGQPQHCARTLGAPKGSTGDREARFFFVESGRTAQACSAHWAAAGARHVSAARSRITEASRARAAHTTRRPLRTGARHEKRALCHPRASHSMCARSSSRARAA